MHVAGQFLYDEIMYCRNWLAKNCLSVISVFQALTCCSSNCHVNLL